MRKYFKPHLYYKKTYWKFYTSLPSEIFDWLKHFFQRGSRGYADKDTWSIDNYLCEIIPEMLRHLKKYHHGHPASLNSIEEWDEILDKIIAGFEAAQRLGDMENWVMNEGNEMVVEEGEIVFTRPWSEEQIKHFKELDDKDEKLFEEGMDLFKKHFFSLWD